MTTFARKPRSDSKLDALDVDQQRQLCKWLLTPGLSYEKVKALVLEKFNVSTTLSALSAFYQSYVTPYLIHRRAQAGAPDPLDDPAADLGKLRPGVFNQATVDALERKALVLANNPFVDPKAIFSIYSLLLKARELAGRQKNFDKRLLRLAALEQNVATAKERLAALGSMAGLSKEALQEIEAIATLL